METVNVTSSQQPELGQLWQEYFTKRTDTLRNQLVSAYMHLANKIARYYFSKRIGDETQYSDYQNMAVIGLIHAVQSYNDDKLAKFETYASYRIKGSILNSIRSFSEKNAYLCHQKQRQQEIINSSLSFMNDDQSLLEKIVEATLDLSYSALLESLVDIEIVDNAAQNHLDGYHHCELTELKQILKKIVGLLPKKQRLVIHYYYYYELSFVEIADLIGISKGRISQIHKQAMGTIREFYHKLTNNDLIY